MNELNVWGRVGEKPVQLSSHLLWIWSLDSQSSCQPKKMTFSIEFRRTSNVLKADLGILIRTNEEWGIGGTLIFLGDGGISLLGPRLPVQK